MPVNAALPDPDFAAASGALGIRTNDALVLRYIAGNPGLTTRKIGAALGIAATTVERIGKQYVAAGVLTDGGQHVRKFHLSPHGLLRAAERYLDSIISAATDKPA